MEDTVTKADKNCQMRRVGPEPFQHRAPDAHQVLQTSNQDVIVHCIKSQYKDYMTTISTGKDVVKNS